MRGKLLLASPCLPASGGGRPVERLLRELSADWEVHPAWLPPAGDAASAAERLLEDLKGLISAGDYAAVLAVEHPAVDACLPLLRLFTHVPIVYISRANGGFGSNGLRPLERFRAREDAERAAACAARVWPLGRRGLSPSLASLGRPARSRPAGASIVIPCFNGLRYTRECLAAVARHTRPPYEVIVVDNGSTDGTSAFVRRRSKVRLIRNRENLGFAKAVNQGMRAARGRYVVWLNNDVVVTPGWLDGLVRCAERSPRIGAVGPCTNETVGLQRVKASYSGTAKLERFAHAWALANAGRAREAHRLVGFCLLLKSEAVRRIGLLDERFSPACYEDYDYCLRLRQAGYDLACALEVFVHHHGHKTFGGGEAMLRRAAASREVFLDKWCRRALDFLDELDAEAAGAPSAARRRSR